MEYSVAVMELESIAKGVQAADDALKAAGVRLVAAQPVCPGKFELIITGELAEVNAALERVRAAYADNLLDSVQLGRIDRDVVKALLGTRPAAPKGAVGVIETLSIASAVLAADTAVKAANVSILELRAAQGIGGKGVVVLTGKVADVTAAVEAGSRYATEKSVFVGNSVIPAPHEELWNYL